jgi:type I restriction enzyme S subunit
MDSHLLRIQPDPRVIDRRYLRLVIQAEQVVGRQLARLSHGTIMSGLSSGIVRLLRVPVPSLHDQGIIAEVLGTVDEAIQQTENLIAKLDQIKQGLLHDLLTRGIDADGQLRDPGSRPQEFVATQLGPIPRSWNVGPLHAACDLQVGFAFSSTWFRNDEGMRLLRGENVGYGVPDWADSRYLSVDRISAFSEFLLSAGDVVIGMDRTFTKSGFKVSQLRDEDAPALLVQRVGRFIPAGASPGFVRCLLASPNYRHQLLRQQKGMDIPHLSRSEILAPLVPLPSLAEQEQITTVVQAAEASTDREMAALNKLHLLRRGLMDDLLQGRVRVSSAVAGVVA